MNAVVQEKKAIQPELGAVVVGGGPAGVALLVAARRGRLLEDLLKAELKIIERTDLVGPGEIGKYFIRSDSLADSFLKAVDPQANPSLLQLLKRSAGKQIDALRGNPVKLSIVGDFLTELAIEVRRFLQSMELNPFITGLEAIRAHRQRDGSWVTTCRRHDGGMVHFHSRTLVIATGAHQPVGRLFDEPVAGVPLLPRFAHKTVQSADFLSDAGLEKIAERLSDQSSPRVAIVGGSHSAIASAHACMQGSLGISFGPASVTVLHRGLLRLTYASAEEALSDGYDAFGSADICRKTGRVFPLAGFRSDSRDLLRRYWGLGGLKPDNRLRLMRLEESRYREANRVLEEADLIVAALGYRPRALPLFEGENKPLDLQSDSGTAPLVDINSRVLDSTGQPIPGVFAIGLAAGYPLAGVHGESSFTAQANGLALWQSDIGANLVSQLLDAIKTDAVKSH